MRKAFIKLSTACVVMALFVGLAIQAYASMADELFPSDVIEQHDEHGWRITRVYELTQNENPANIPRDPFTRNNWVFSLADITRRDTTITDVRNHVETFHIDTETDVVSEITAMLQNVIEYTSVDGYTGVLELDKGSVTTEVSETRNTPWTQSVTREYPHMINNDTSLIPKTVRDRNMEYTLSNVQWKAGNTTTVDYIAIPDYYTAIATYTRSGSSARPVAFVATVRYEGTISKSEPGKTIYTAHFLGEEIYSSPSPSPSPVPVPQPSPLPVSPSPSPSPEPAESSAPTSQPIDINTGEDSGGGGGLWGLIFIPIAGGLGYGGYVFWKKQKERAEEEDDE